MWRYLIPLIHLRLEQLQNCLGLLQTQASEQQPLSAHLSRKNTELGRKQNFHGITWPSSILNGHRHGHGLKMSPCRTTAHGLQIQSFSHSVTKSPGVGIELPGQPKKEGNTMSYQKGWEPDVWSPSILPIVQTPSWKMKALHLSSPFSHSAKHFLAQSTGFVLPASRGCDDQGTN